MVFSSYIFILVFLPVVIITYYGLSRIQNNIPQRVFLIVASLFFYGYYNLKYLILIIGSILANYVIAYLMSRRRFIGGVFHLSFG